MLRVVEEGGCLEGGRQGGDGGAPGKSSCACFRAVVKEEEEIGNPSACSVLR